MVIYLLIGALIFWAYQMVKFFTGTSFSEMISELITTIFSFGSGTAKKIYLKNKQSFGHMSKWEKEHSKKVKYYQLVNEILLALNLTRSGVTVEGFVVLSIIITIVIALLCSQIFKGLVLLIISGIVFVLVHAIAFLLSRMGYRERKKHIMDAIDMLCGEMSDGIVKAVESSMHLINPSIRNVFERFLNNIQVLSVSVDDALVVLNGELGEVSDSFISAARDFEKNHSKGMDQLFSFIVTDNAKLSLLDTRISRTMAAVNMDFFATLGLLGAFLMYTYITYDYVQAFYNTAFGQFILLVYISLAAATFVYNQYLLAKPI